MPHEYYRILIAKVGLDGHDRGAKVIVRALRDAGFEVIYTGLHQTPAQIVKIASQEDVDAIGVSILSGSHIEQFKAITEALNLQNMGHIVLFGGGIIPEIDKQELNYMGVECFFLPNSRIEDIVSWLRKRLKH